MASSADLAEVASSADLAEVTSSVDFAGDVTIGVTSLTDPASVVTTGVAFREKCGHSVVIPSDCGRHDDNVAEVVPSVDLAGDVIVGVTSLANPASVVTAGVAFREKCGNSVVIPSDSGCHDHNVAEVASSADLAGNVTVGVTSLADHVSVVTAGVAYREQCGDSAVVSNAIMMTIFMIDIMTIDRTILTMMIRVTMIDTLVCMALLGRISMRSVS